MAALRSRPLGSVGAHIRVRGVKARGNPRAFIDGGCAVLVVDQGSGGGPTSSIP